MSSNSHVYAVVLAGGSGTRFWPVSRQARPKQFLALGSTEESLIQATARRIMPLLNSSSGSKLLVITNKSLSDQVLEHVPQAISIAEPCGRNTAASIGLAALKIHKEDPSGIMIVLPADHSVSNEDSLRRVLSTAIEQAQLNDALVTIGISPESPNTAYGYIQRGEKKAEDSYKVARFYEKPNVERAIEYCEAGNFYWNSGMFVWKASTILEAFSKHMPKLFSALERIRVALDTPQEQQVMQSEFDVMESISIDFGVLEHANNCMVVEAKPFGWNDVGSWDAWAHHFTPDSSGNVSSGDILQIQSKNCISLTQSPGKRVVALLGVENLVVVDTADAILICDRSKVQDVKLIVDALRKQGRGELL